MRRGRNLNVVAIVGSPILAGVMMLMLAGLAQAWSTSSWTAPWGTVTTDEAPCIGHDNYYMDQTSLSSGVFNGYSDNLANGDYWCNADTTQHEDFAGAYGVPNFSPSTTGSLTLTAAFSGTVWVWGSQNGCDHGTGHAFFKIGVGAYDFRTGKSIYTWIVPHGLSVSNSCGSGGVQASVGSVSVVGTFYAGDSYRVSAGIDEQSGAIEYWQGSNAEGFVGFENVCWSEGGGTSSTIALLYISVS